MRLGLCTISNKDLAVEDVIEVARAAGADGIEVWGKDHVGDGSPDTCRRIAAAAEERSLEVPVYGSYLRPGSADFDADLDGEVRIADELGADLIRVWAGEQEYQDCEDAHWEQVVADTRRLAEAAADRDVGVTIERHSGTVTNRTEGAARLIEETPDRVGLNWQPYFEHDADTVLEDAERLAPLSNNVHMQAVGSPGASTRVALPDAYFDVAGIVDAFAESGFDGYLEVEFVTQKPPYDAAVAADVAFLRALLRTT